MFLKDAILFELLILEKVVPTFPLITSSNSLSSLTQRVREEEEAVGGVGGYREVTGILPDPNVGHNGGTGGTLNIQQGGWPHQAHSRGEDPTKYFIKEG